MLDENEKESFSLFLVAGEVARKNCPPKSIQDWAENLSKNMVEVDAFEQKGESRCQ